MNAASKSKRQPKKAAQVQVSARDTNGKVTSLTLDGSATILNGVLYELFGPASGWNWGNGTIAVRGFDLDGKVEYIDSAGLRSYSYDNAFRITGITDATDPNLSQAYGYDLLDRLTSATGTSVNQSWTYDANGNRLSQGGSAPTSYTISSNSNRLLSTTGALNNTYTYDAAGSITGDGTTTFAYDDAGRMISATQAGQTTSYALNALGQRVKKSHSGGTTYFVYDESGHLIGEYDGSGNLIQEMIWLGDTPVASLRMDETGTSVGLFYIHTDHLNTPRKMTRPTDNGIVWRWDSDPFGTAALDEDPDGNALLVQQNLRFPGQYFDQETGLHYNYFRDYDPATGRYVQSDPIGLQGGLNTYAYVNDNPISGVDYFGLSPDWTCNCKSRPSTIYAIPGEAKLCLVDCSCQCDANPNTKRNLTFSNVSWDTDSPGSVVCPYQTLRRVPSGHPMAPDLNEQVFNSFTVNRSDQSRYSKAIDPLFGKECDCAK